MFSARFVIRPPVLPVDLQQFMPHFLVTSTALSHPGSGFVSRTSSFILIHFMVAYANVVRWFQSVRVILIRGVVRKVVMCPVSSPKGAVWPIPCGTIRPSLASKSNYVTTILFARNFVLIPSCMFSVISVRGVVVPNLVVKHLFPPVASYFVRFPRAISSPASFLAIASFQTCGVLVSPLLLYALEAL